MTWKERIRRARRLNYIERDDFYEAYGWQEVTQRKNNEDLFSLCFLPGAKRLLGAFANAIIERDLDKAESILRKMEKLKVKKRVDH